MISSSLYKKNKRKQSRLQLLFQYKAVVKINNIVSIAMI